MQSKERPSVTKANPFPGMNPWMQGGWSDMHTRMIGYIADVLSSELPDDLVARAEENIALSSPSLDSQRKSDGGVIETEEWKRGKIPVWTPLDDADLANRIAEPTLVVMDNVTERWIEIRTVNGKLITVIELTSPANKTKKGRTDFEEKLHELLDGGVNFVEIDLIRGGQSARDHRTVNWPESTYLLTVNRASNQSVAEVYGVGLREPLPAIRIPLRNGEPDAALDLQPLINRCHENGRYWTLPYRNPPVPALTDDDAQWAQGILENAELI